MEREQTISVSFAPEPGEVSPFERLCRLRYIHWLEFYEGDELVITTVSRDENDDEETVKQSLITYEGEPIDFDTALQLASLQLLARLEEQ